MSEETLKLIVYFKLRYIDGQKILSRVKKHIKNIPAFFSTSVLNVHKTTLDDIERTNNHTENWYHRFSKFVSQTIQAFDV